MEISDTWRKRWVQEKRAIAQRLAAGEAGGDYPEAVILVCAALSALSAEVWPGRRIDRVRFIELLVRLGSSHAFCMTVSVPLLTQSLEDDQKLAEATEIRRQFDVPRTACVLIGPEIDRPEPDILAACPSLELRHIRRFSYASLLYQEIRSSYAHTYRPGNAAGSWPMTMLPDQRISYINQLRESDRQLQRLIHFHVGWLGELAVDLAEAVDETVVPWANPATWWADGA